MQIEAIQSQSDIERYADFAAEVYQGNPYWVAPDRHHITSLVGGTSPFASHCRLQPFWAKEDGRVKATATAVVDDSFNQHWSQMAGHVCLFEVLPDAGSAAGAVLNAACEWLAAQGCTFARHGFLPGWQLPLTIDAYDASPTFFHTYNPAYYHNSMKNAHFVTERGLVQCQVQFDDRSTDLYRAMLEPAASTGVRIRPWDFTRLEEETEVFTAVLNRTFAAHWGFGQFTVAQMSSLTVDLKEYLVPEFTAFAETGGRTIGTVFAFPDLNQAMRGETIDHGVLLVIGVDQDYRGKGISLAMAARSYLAMLARGYRKASYTLVLDDNWPSRRTAEKLGAKVIRNFVVYRRELTA